MQNKNFSQRRQRLLLTWTCRDWTLKARNKMAKSKEMLYKKYFQKNSEFRYTDHYMIFWFILNETFRNCSDKKILKMRDKFCVNFKNKINRLSPGLFCSGKIGGATQKFIIAQTDNTTEFLLRECFDNVGSDDWFSLEFVEASNLTRN